jgi:hypothetical protein
MVHLHAVNNQFKDQGLIILSLSLDKKPEDVDQFRKEQWDMPWLHSFVEGGFGSSLAESLEAWYVPKPILVGPDGIIIATGDALRGEQLVATIARHLQKPL